MYQVILKSEKIFIIFIILKDVLKTILSSNTTRRGLFNLFELFQHKTLNKRLIHVFIENLLINLFPLNSNQNIPAAFTANTGGGVTGAKSSQIQTYIRNYLTKSSRVRPEFKQIFSTFEGIGCGSVGRPVASDARYL